MINQAKLEADMMVMVLPTGMFSLSFSFSSVISGCELDAVSGLSRSYHLLVSKKCFCTVLEMKPRAHQMKTMLPQRL